MSRIARLCKGAGPLAVGGLVLSCALARAGDPPPLTDQLLARGREAVAQGRPVEARNFYRQVLKLDARNTEAKQALQRLGSGSATIRRVGLQDPAGDAPA